MEENVMTSVAAAAPVTPLVATKEYFSMSELNGSNACAKARDFAISLTNTESTVKQKVVVMKELIHEYLDCKIPPAQIHNFLVTNFALIAFQNETQRNYQCYEAERQVIRYLNYAVGYCSHRINHTNALVEISEQIKPVLVAPDYVLLHDGVLRIISIKCSAPKVSSKSSTKDLGLYAMIKYGRQIADKMPAGTVESIQVEYHYLRKSTDKGAVSKDGEHFDYDFITFNEKGNLSGGNKVELVEGMGENERAATDFDFEPAVEEFVNGIEEQNCSKDDCNNCKYNTLCKYNEAPLAIVKERVQRSITEIALSPAQEAAVDYERGLLRVIAGAGAGKTLTVALRVAVLIQKGYKPSEILMMTFSNAGAEEMKERIGLYMADFGMTEDPNEIVCTTFNSFGYEIVKKEYARFGFTSEPTVIDDIDRSRIISELLNTHHIPGLNYRDYLSNMAADIGALEMTRRVFSLIKANNWTKADIPLLESALGSAARFLTVTKTPDGVTPSTESVLDALFDLYDMYDAKLISENLVEFADQEVLLFRLLEEDPYYLNSFGFKHVIVDEFQDTSMSQMRLIKILRQCPSFMSGMFVGDDSQAIYSFRDTSPEYIVHLPEIMGEHVDDIPQLENHRSTPEVIDFANKINANNIDRIEKDLIATRPHGAPVIVEGFLSKEDEINYVVHGAAKHYKKGIQTAVIAATNDELYALAAEFNKLGVQTVMLNPQKYAENSRILASIALANLMRNYSDTEDAVIYYNAKIGGGAMTFNPEQVERMIKEAKEDASEINAIGNPGAKKQVFLDTCKALDQNEDEVFLAFLDTIGHKESLEKIFEYIDNFYVFGTDAGMKRTHNYPGVVLTTAHSSKGLEWPCVYDMITKYDSKGLTKQADIEEKRRLFFVSATRARDELIVTSQYISHGNVEDGYEPNRFLVEAFEAVGKEFDLGTVLTQKDLRSAEAASDRKLAALARKIARDKILGIDPAESEKKLEQEMRKVEKRKEKEMEAQQAA